MFRPRLRRSDRSPACSLDFTRHDSRLPNWLTFTRADASPCATRRRIHRSAGPSRTNYVLDNSVPLASPGFLSGVTFTIVGSGSITVHGVTFAYTDIAVSGASSVTGTILTHDLMGGAMAADFAAPGAQFTASVYLELRAGALNGAVLNCRVEEATTGNVAIAGTSTDSSAFAGGTARLTATRVFSDPTAARGRVKLRMGATNGTSYNFTFRVYAAQLEKGDKATPAIRSAGAWGVTTDWPRTNLAVRSVSPTPRDGRSGQNASSGNGTESWTLTDMPDGTPGRVAEFTAHATLASTWRWGNTSQGVAGRKYVGSLWIRLKSGSFTSGGPNLDLSDNGAPGFTLTSAWKRVYHGYAHPTQPYCFLDLNLPAGTAVVQVAMVLIEEDQLGTGLPSAWFDEATTNTPPYGDIQTLAANEPRIEYKSDGTARGLRLEASMTQHFKRTDFDSSAWGQNPANLRTEGYFGPQGQKAVLINTTAATSNYLTGNAFALTAGVKYLRAVKAKPLAGSAASRRVLFEYIGGGTVTTFNLDNFTAAVGSTGGTAGVTALDDGWYLCWHLLTPASAYNSSALYFDAYGAVATGGFQALVCDPMLIFGATSETVSQITNLTTTPSAVRANENLAVLDLSNIGVNPEGFTILVEWEQGPLNVSGKFGQLIEFSDGTSSNKIFVFQNFNGEIYSNCSVGGVQTFGVKIGTAAPSSVAKLAFAMRPTGVLASINGATPTQISGAVPVAAFTRAHFAGNQGNNPNQYLDGYLRKFRSWSRVLTQAELQALSA